MWLLGFARAGREGALLLIRSATQNAAAAATFGGPRAVCACVLPFSFCIPPPLLLLEHFLCGGRLNFNRARVRKPGTTTLQRSRNKRVPRAGRLEPAPPSPAQPRCLGPAGALMAAPFGDAMHARGREGRRGTKAGPKQARRHACGGGGVCPLPGAPRVSLLLGGLLSGAELALKSNCCHV